MQDFSEYFSEPIGKYLSCKEQNGVLFVSGQVARHGDEVYSGKVSSADDIPAAQKAAELCCKKLLAQVQNYVKDLSEVKSCLKITVFVNADPNFTDIVPIANVASEMLINVLGEEVGAHTRAAVGCATLPAGSLVEIEGIFGI